MTLDELLLVAKPSEKVVAEVVAPPPLIVERAGRIIDASLNDTIIDGRVFPRTIPRLVSERQAPTLIEHRWADKAGVHRIFYGLQED